MRVLNNHNCPIIQNAHVQTNIYLLSLFNQKIHLLQAQAALLVSLKLKTNIIKSKL
ncbi:hypothetical protein SAMN05660226_04167 [Parapedobacter luteus]|uniref:Uncharacterized protein n=1 Tax=Parapedobacter luteus TaxID=623280 RepID=A0A1T5FSC0_9SPHI|nr:hypothetical protein SAMN05660226_04167 [Parapedobacter luteus]